MVGKTAVFVLYSLPWIWFENEIYNLMWNSRRWSLYITSTFRDPADAVDYGMGREARRSAFPVSHTMLLRSGPLGAAKLLP